jgi:flagellin
MSLGVLNNISALYAENNLNNTQNNLQNTLQELSSGTTLNSGADNPAGLSLADGLSANSAALTQSATNASDGVGLLQVADGALSQVNSLLNSAVTLATEASNGTLNSTQDAAANQEYQSILSEINNIGTTRPRRERPSRSTPVTPPRRALRSTASPSPSWPRPR